MRKMIPLITLLAMLSGPAGAQPMSSTVKVQALGMAKALMDNDFNTLKRYMHPSFVASAGGEERMRAKGDSAYAAMKRFGATFKRYWIGEPGPIVRQGSTLQTTLPQSTTVKMSLGEVTVNGTLLAVSGDGGKSWWFVDTNLYKPEKLRSIFAELSPAIVIPPRQKPKLVPAGKGQGG